MWPFVRYHYVQLNGKYGIQRTNFLFVKKYLDLDNAPVFWWPKCYLEKYCLGTQEQCEEAFARVTAKPRKVISL